jgi:UDP-GlcNAc:undecaprenyl-phosphate/decaprenyl-phosphate GlcNAc-1-phosphate transferase
MTFIIILVSILFNIFFIKNNNKIADLLRIYDEPDFNRKIHKSNVPLTGGIMIVLNILILSFLIFSNLSDINFYSVFSNYFDFVVFINSVIIFFFIGFFDDKYKISATKKFLIMIFLLLVIILISDDLLINKIKISFVETVYSLPVYLSIFWTLLCFLLFVNALNMFDGINYQVSVYSIYLCLFFIINNYFSIFFIMILISLTFFLFLNHKNKAFLGDSGSYLLGFIFSYFFVKFYNTSNYIYTDQIVLFMIIPGLDLMRLFIYRIYKGNAPFSADKNHLHYILLEKNSLITTNLKVFLLILFPSIMGFYFGYTLIFLTIQLIAYFFFVFIK